MFEALKNMAMSVHGGSTVKPPQVVLPTQTVEKKADKPAPENVLSIDQAKRVAEQKAADEKQARENQQVTEKMLEELEQDFETMHNVELKFSKHDASGRIMIKVLNKENDEVIREIPSEEVLNLAAKIEEMIGILFDKEV